MDIVSAGKRGEYRDDSISDFLKARADYLTGEELHKLINSIEDSRDRLIVKLLFELGCTQKELVNIRVRDVDFKRFSVNIHKKNTRNNHERPSFISINLSNEITNYLKLQKRLEKKAAYLLQTRQSSKMTPRRIRQIIKCYTTRIGLEGKSHPQVIRYTHLIHAYKKRIPLSAIEDQVGLKKARLIQIISGIALPDSRKEYRQFLEAEDESEIVTELDSEIGDDLEIPKKNDS